MKTLILVQYLLNVNRFAGFIKKDLNDSNKETMMKNWEEFHAEIEKLSLTELEKMIKEQYKEFQRSHAYKDDRLDSCLSQRMNLINANFKFTPEAIKHIERVNRVLMDGRAKMLKRCGLLFRQMLQLKKQGDDFLDDFYVEGTMTIQFKDEESILTLDEDENNGQSDYVTMADILNFTDNIFDAINSFTFIYSEDKDPEASDEELGILDDCLDFNWDIELLAAPELSGIEYFCYPSHVLFCDMKYSLSDIIRIREFSIEVKVIHENFEN